MPKKKPLFNKTQVKQTLALTIFDPEVSPMEFILETNNPTYALSRARESLSLIVGVNLLNDNNKAYIIQAHQMLTAALMLINSQKVTTTNGTKTTKDTPGTKDPG